MGFGAYGWSMSLLDVFFVVGLIGALLVIIVLLATFFNPREE